MDEDWYTAYKDYKSWLSEGNIEPEQDNPSDDWEECLAQEAAELQMWEREDYNDYWFEYADGERANDT